MKWTAKDIYFGMWVTKPLTRGNRFVPSGWRAKWMDMICWDSFTNARTRYCVRTNITDGMLIGRFTKAEMATWLNENGMIPAPTEWVVKMVEWLGKHADYSYMLRKI